MTRPIAALVACALACAGRESAPPPADAGPPAAEDGGRLPAPVLRWIDPNFGPVQGGTAVTLAGDHFVEGALVTFGTFFADDVVVVSSRRITARTPAALFEGPVNVRVTNPDGQFAELVDGFFYEPPPPIPIGYCALLGPASVVVAPSEAFDARGVLFVEGLTPGEGRGEGVRVQAGFGFPGTDPGTWTWLPAAYERDVDGLTPGDLANDQYRATVSVPLPGSFRLAFRASGDGGQSWTYCDLDGSTNGFAEAATAELTVRVRAVDFCNLQYPPMAVAAPGVETEPFFGRVYARGVTDAPGPGAGVLAQLGYGPPGESPITEAWSWVDAVYNLDVPGLDPGVLANDEYRAALTVPSPGTYDVAYRFSLDDGITWKYCDLDGSDNGYASAQAAVLVVAPPGGGVDWCRFEGPAMVSAVLGEATAMLRGRVFVDGVTPGQGRGAAVRGQVGFGPLTAAVNSPAWTWTEAAYLGDVDGLSPGDLADDEYGARITATLPGTYAVAYRFSRDDGQSWSYCDLDGLDNGFDLAAQTGRLEVQPLSVGWCQTNRPASAQALPGDTTTFFGRLFVQGRTPGDGRGADIVAQVGFGAESDDPTSWTWSPARYVGDADGLSPGDKANDEYAGDVSPPTTGAYRVVFRFSVDGGQSFTLCDLGGSSDGFAAADAAALTVVQPVVGYCELTGPATIRTPVSQASAPVAGRVFVAGRTPGVGPGSGVRGQLGFGPPGVAPTLPSWSWSEATYHRDVDGLSTGDLANDEYTGRFQVGTPGTYATAFRFSTDGGASWTLCDRDGSTNGFDTAQAGTLIVDPPPPTIGNCRLESPRVVVAHRGTTTPPLHALLYVAGVTDAAGPGPGVTGQVGYGTGDPSGWTWVAASYEGDGDIGGLSADAYAGAFTVPARGEHSYTFRFSVDGGQSWTVCDGDGSANGLDPLELGLLSAREPIEWCNLQFPETTSTVAGVPTVDLFGRLRVPGVTDGAGQGDDVVAEVGFGPAGSSPDDRSWSWSPATFNAAADGGEYDEYAGQLTIGTAGSYLYSFRYSTDDAQTWCYGRLAGSGNLGALTVHPRAIGDARVQPPATIHAVAGLPVEPVFGQVRVPGLTERPGTSPLLVAEVGIGPDGSDPGVATGWTWSEAMPNPAFPAGDYDEYHGSVIAPAAPGFQALAARFRFSDSATWTFADLDGSQNGYQAAMAKRLDVAAPAGGGIDFCTTQFPTSVDVTVGPAGGATPVLYGRVFKSGVTPGAGWGRGIAGQVGWGPKAQDPASWPAARWAAAGYRRDVDGLSPGDQSNDEYEAVLFFAPGTSGSDLGFAYRFTADGVNWTYCGVRDLRIQP